MHEMSGQHDRKSRKRKMGPKVKCSIKVSAARWGRAKRSKTHSAPESTSLVSRTLIACECHLYGGRRRCLASPVQDGKENDARTGAREDGYRRSSAELKCEEVDHDGTGKDLDLNYPDDDSNHILPVEQFFGNLEVVQDLPRESSTTSDSVKRRNRRQRFRAREDSDEEEANFIGSRQDDDDNAGF